jgi:maltose alpha-D-glucosyltransferase/alpha-amylase
MFGGTPFPALADAPYRLTLGPHNFLWFVLAKGVGVGAPSVTAADHAADLPRIEVRRRWASVLEGGLREQLELLLARWIVSKRWFGGKSRRLRDVKIEDAIPLPLEDGEDACIALVRVGYVEEEADRYLIPLGWMPTERLTDTAAGARSAICRVAVRAQGRTRDGLLVEAVGIPAFGRALLSLIAKQDELPGSDGQLIGLLESSSPLELTSAGQADARVRVAGGEQSNTSLVYDDRFILKLFRRIEAGTNLDRELGEFLTKAGFHHVPPVLGAIEHRSAQGGVTTVGLLQAFVPNQGDAWDFTLDALQRYFESCLASTLHCESLPLPGRDLVGAARRPLPAETHRVIDEAYLDAVRLLGCRTGQMHLSLASGDTHDTRPESFSQLYQRSLYQGMRNLVGRTLRSLEQALPRLAGQDRDRAESILASRERLLAAFKTVLERRVEGQRIRIHGDYHLGQVLYTGRDFAIIDFEGEPARPLSERRLKRSALRDVAAMLRSFHYAAVAAFFRELERGLTAEPKVQALEGWARFWHRWVSVTFLKGYLEAVNEAAFLPGDDRARQMLLDIYLLEKAISELGYELDNRPGWMRIPVEGILELIRPEGGA